MSLARRHLRLDVALVSRIGELGQEFEAVEGDAQAFGLAVGGSVPLEETYCDLMLRGQIPSVVPDAASDSRLAGLAATGPGGIGSYVGVPLRYSDGTLYGTFCCLGRDAQAHLTERDGEFLTMLAELLTDDLDAHRDQERLRASIHDTITAGRLKTAVQPVVDLATGRCAGFEALSRFDIGFPDVVFAQARSVGLGVDLELVAARKAHAVLPLLGRGQYLAVNLTPDAAVPLCALAAAAADPMHRLVLELTEHASVQDYRRLREALAPLRERGLRIAIDDAGAGFASLHHIVELEPDIIKIDRSLIDGISSNKALRSIVTGFVLLALDSGATLVAEGVETTEDLRVLASLGVDAAQGYLLARPSTDPADLARWIATPDMRAGLL
jgi:EAL domain-containing protein (putative c-di-GMP-specific phosphodiesterase class I)